METQGETPWEELPTGDQKQSTHQRKEPAQKQVCCGTQGDVMFHFR